MVQFVQIDEEYITSYYFMCAEVTLSHIAYNARMRRKKSIS